MCIITGQNILLSVGPTAHLLYMRKACVTCLPSLCKTFCSLLVKLPMSRLVLAFIRPWKRELGLLMKFVELPNAFSWNPNKRNHFNNWIIIIVILLLFRISQSNNKKGNLKNLDLDFLIEIHPEDGFLGSEIRFRISRSIGKSRFRFWKSKSGFPNRTHPKTLFTWSGGPRSSGVGLFCFVSPRAWKQKKSTPLGRGPPLQALSVSTWGKNML